MGSPFLTSPCGRPTSPWRPSSELEWGNFDDDALIIMMMLLLMNDDGDADDDLVTDG